MQPILPIPISTRPYWTGIAVTFFSYVCVHAGRKAFTNTKSIAVDYLGIDPTTAGALDAVFMLSYAIGLVAFGGLADYKNPLFLLFFSLIGMSVLQMTFVEICTQGLASESFGLAFLFLVWTLNGLIQSLTWPSCVKLVQCYLFDYHRKTTVFSVWACNGIVGNIVCSVIAELVVGKFGDSVDSFRSVFFITSVLNLVMSVVVLQLPAVTGQFRERGSDHNEPNQSVCETLKVRGVLDYSFCHLCIKGVAYAMFFWLPFYLTRVYKVDPGDAARISIVYDLATAIGGPICGLLVEKTGKPAILISIAVVVAAGPQILINSTSDTGLARLLVSASVPYGVIINIVVSGFLVGGVLNVLSAAICVSLGGGHSAARVRGIIDGFGSLGASATQILIPLVSVGEGWGSVFGLLGILLMISALTLVRIIKDELHVSM